jgi:Nitroreductase
MNETMNAILNRYSCRAYTDEPVNDEALKMLADAALAAPTAMNRQAYRVVVIKDKALIDKMDAKCMESLKNMEDQSTYNRFMERGGTLFYNATAMFMLPIEKGSQTDLGIVAQNICLAAQSLGLGSCHCGMARLIFDGGRKEAYEKLFQFPKGYEFGLAVLVGHSAKTAAAHPLDESKVLYI